MRKPDKGKRWESQLDNYELHLWSAAEPTLVSLNAPWRQEYKQIKNYLFWTTIFGLVQHAGKDDFRINRDDASVKKIWEIESWKKQHSWRSKTTLSSLDIKNVWTLTITSELKRLWRSCMAQSDSDNVSNSATISKIENYGASPDRQSLATNSSA